MTINEIYKKIIKDRDKAKEKYEKALKEYEETKDKEIKSKIWEDVITLDEKTSTLNDVIELLESSGEIDER